MNTLFSIVLSASFFQSDSLQTDTTLIFQQSIMFQQPKQVDLKTYKYNHIQGFFCDFEDRINKKQKINLNIGVGDQ